MRSHFERVVCIAAIAAGVTSQQRQSLVISREMQLAQAAFRVFKSVAQQVDELLFLKRLEHINAAAREQCGDDFERWIFSGRADEANSAALDVGEESVLLRLIETMDFVNEQDGARAHARGLFRLDHDLLDLFDAAHDGREFKERRLRGFGNNLRK